MFINTAKRIVEKLSTDIGLLLLVPGVDKMVSTEFVLEKLEMLKRHIADYDQDRDENPLDEAWIYEIQDEITADLADAYALIENYETTEDYEPSNY